MKRPTPSRSRSPRRVRGLRSAVETGLRVFLRRPTARDREEFIALRTVSAAFLRPWEPRSTARGHRAMFERYLRSAGNGDARRFLVCRLEDGAIMGHVGLGAIIRGPFQSCFFGYWIGDAHARRGYMTEAIGLALRHAFRTLRLHRVEANIMPHNKASLALVRRLGFRYEGLARRYLQIAGRWRDHEHWAMTVEDWRRRGRGLTR